MQTTHLPKRSYSRCVYSGGSSFHLLRPVMFVDQLYERNTSACRGVKVPCTTVKHCLVVWPLLYSFFVFFLSFSGHCDWLLSIENTTQDIETMPLCDGCCVFAAVSLLFACGNGFKLCLCVACVTASVGVQIKISCNLDALWHMLKLVWICRSKYGAT